MSDRILIVDDNLNNIQVLGNILSEKGYEIEIAMNGDDALEFVKEYDFDMILLDVMMPGKDGFEVCATIRQNKKFDNTPIIFLTAKSDIESLVKGFDVGGQDFLTKPFNSKELLARAKTHLDLKQHKDKLNDLVALRTQQLDKAYKELEVLDTAKVEFLHMLSHEIRTPLHGIISFLEILKNQINSEELLGYLLHLTDSVDRLEEFSLKALLITTLRTKAHKLIFEDINLVELLNNTLQDLKTEFEDKSIEIITSFSANKIFINADVLLISNCLKEIINNVLDHSATANKISIRIIDNELQTKIEILDNGIGFSEKALEAIFKPFGFGNKHINNNAGLGLHLVKLIMEEHNFNVNTGNNFNGGAFVHLIINK